VTAGFDVLLAEEQRIRALVQQDYSGTAALSHPKLMYVHADGTIDNRTSYLRRLREPGIRILSQTHQPLSVERFGDFTVLVGTSELVGVSPTGAEQSARIRFASGWSPSLSLFKHCFWFSTLL
jgi:hypothetical protein